MNRTSFQRPLAVLFIFFAYATITAQGWERTFGGVSSDVANALLPTPDKGWLMVGTTQSFGAGDRDVYLLKTDVDGIEQWHRRLGLASAEEFGNDVVALTDGYLIAGNSVENDNSRGILLRTDKLGRLVWSVILPADSIDIQEVALCVDGGFAVTGRRLNASGKDDVFVAKTDASGAMEWSRLFGGNDVDQSTGIVGLANGDLLLAGFTNSGRTSVDAFLMKLSADGDSLWQKLIGTPAAEEQALCLIPSQGGGFILAGLKNDLSATEDDGWVVKTDADGELIWDKTFAFNGLEKAKAVFENPDGSILIAGERRADMTSDRNGWLLKMKADGNVEWSHTFGGQAGDDFGAAWGTSEGGAVACGFTQSFGVGSADAYLVRTDAAGRGNTATIQGRIFIDEITDCLYQTSETGIPNWLIEVTGSKNYYASADADGRYSLTLDTGRYTVRLVLPNDYWQPCQNGTAVTITNRGDIATVDFPVQKTSDCSFLNVDVSTPFLRRCFPNTYSVRFCNLGTQTAADAEVEIQFDPFLEIDSASLLWSSRTGNTFTFSVGDLAPLECGIFKVFATVNCDSTVLGQSHCVRAHIRPDSICQTPDPAWDGASLEVDAECVGDSVILTIRNVGKADMTSISDFIIIEDQIIYRTGGVQLPSSGLEVFTRYPDGRMVRLEVEQPNGHPGKSHPSISVEGCGGAPFSIGYVTQYPQDDGDNFIEIDCQENIGAYDPNDKNGSPKGYGGKRQIDQNQDIEYLIRFQNTGTDTAFKVVIRDTLDEHLDASAILPGASSHPYRFELYGNGIVKFTFDNILLPDSTSNEPGSHGFVKYRIAQKTDLPLGTLLTNNADIYFDFNTPITTNQTTHQVGKNFVLVSTKNQPGQSPVFIKTYPTPTLEKAIIESPDVIFRGATFQLLDAFGHVIRKEAMNASPFEFHRNGLPAGVYFFQILTAKGQVATGKIILQ